VMQAWPVNLFLRARLEGAGLADAGVALVLGLGGAFLLTGVIATVSFRVGINRLREAELFTGEGG
jgi:hypothetical protein